MVKPATMLLAAMLCSMPAFDPALAETPAAACLTANGQRLYNIRPFRNTPLSPGCRTGDTLVRFQLEQPGTTVRKLRNTLTAPGERLLARLGDFEIRQVFEASPGFSRCEIAVEVSQDAFRLGGVAGADPNDIAVDGATFFIDQNRVDVQEIGVRSAGDLLPRRSFFLRMAARCSSTMWSRSRTSGPCPMVASPLPPSALPRTRDLSTRHEPLPLNARAEDPARELAQDRSLVTHQGEAAGAGEDRDRGAGGSVRSTWGSTTNSSPSGVLTVYSMWLPR